LGFSNPIYPRFVAKLLKSVIHQPQMAGEHIVAGESPIDIQLYPQCDPTQHLRPAPGEGVTPVGAKEALKVASPGGPGIKFG